MADFQIKLSELEKRQSKLVAENANLKRLCQYLNDQRVQSFPTAIAGVAVSRDSGDGSSGSSPSLDKSLLTICESATIVAPHDVQLKPQQTTKGILVNTQFS